MRWSWKGNKMLEVLKNKKILDVLECHEKDSRIGPVGKNLSFEFCLSRFWHDLQSNLRSQTSPILNSSVLDQIVHGKNVSVVKQRTRGWFLIQQLFHAGTCTMISHTSLRQQQRFGFLTNHTLNSLLGWIKFENQGSYNLLLWKEIDCSVVEELRRWGTAAGSPI